MVKRSFALMTAAAVAFATLVAAPTAASAQQPAVQPAVTDFAQDLALHYDFSTVSGTTVPDASGNGRAGTIKGTGATVAGNVLTLPGGTSTSTAGYVQLPTGMFDGKDTLTISTWLKNETAAGNYAAMFFGSAASTPAQYWLLNPKNPSSRFKSVITNGNSTSAPWGTEAGISPTTAANGINGPVTTNAWGLYTTVIEPTQITGYFNGEKIGTVATSRTVTQFGTGLVGYIGRSSYSDAYYKGGVRDVKVWTAALDSAAVQSEFYAGADEATILAALEADRSALSIGASTVTSDITLSTAGAKGSAITWASSAPDVVSTSGTVVRPTDGENAEVTLTATLTLAGHTAQRAFTVTVLPETPDADLSFEAERWVVEPVVASGQALPQPSGRFTAAWATETPGISVVDGVITSTSEEAVEAQIDLTLGLNDAVGTLTKHFTVTVLPGAGTKYVLGYERTPLAQATYGPKVAYSLHLALGDGASSWTALNENYGVLFAKAQATEQLDIVSTRTLRDPFIFRLANGDFGVVATRALADGADDQSGKILYFTSPDLKQYTEVGLLDLGSTGGVNAPRAVWDSAADTYRLSWTTDAGATLHAAVGDLADSDTVGDARTGGLTLHSAEVSTTITGAVAKNAVPVSADTATALNGRFGRIANTSVSVDDVTVEAGGAVSLDGTKADLEYSDGSSAEFPIDWNAASIASIDTTTPGDYEVTGTVRQRSYSAPFIGAEADPSIIKYNGKYLFISTDDAGVGIGATAMYLRQADTINGLKTAADHAIARVNVSNMKGCFWAPELHEIDGELYVFFSPCVGTASWTAVQSFVSKLEGDDPTVEANWTAAQPVLKADGSALRRDADHPGISLDMTTFEHDGAHYVAWSQRYITGSTGDAEIWIATIDPANPWRLTSEPVKLVTSEYGWDTNTSNVAEGPYFIERDGTVFLTYSGSNIDTTYALGLLTAPSGSSLIDPAVWTKWNAPVLKTDSAIAQLGPGHNSFTVDEDGKDVLVYHAKSTASSSRDTYLRRVHWAADGRPVLDMSRDEEVKPSLRTVTTTVTVLSDGTIKVPAAPAKPTVAVDGDDVTVSWQRPGDGGSPITSYIVRLYSGTDVAREVAVPDATRRSAVLEGIADGKYTAKVVAVNAVGNSPESAASERAQVGAALLAQYDFEGLVSAPAAGSLVPDVSGEGRNATVRGTGVTSTGGALSLPGGASTSTAGYVQLPTGLFDGQNTVTVSAWLKNETAAGNYAALFFGTTETNPSQYWLLNPKNPSGLVKNVLTNGLSTSAPWGTEAGLSPTTAANGVAGPAAKDGWTLHTAVIQPGSITGYVDGVKIGTVPTTRTVSQFGDGLVSYIGKSSYPDALWKGSIRDLSIYSTVLSDADVKAAYWNGVDDNALVDAALAADAEALDLGDGWVTGDLDLPGTGSKGSTIAWTSSVPATIAAGGTVQRPETGDVPVTLTATLTLAGRTVTRDFALTVLADTPQNDLRVIAERYSLGITKTSADIVLPAEVGGTTVAWTSSVPGSIAASGAVTRGDSSVDVTLTAVFTKEGLTATRTFDVTVLPRDAGRIGAYIREGATVRTDVLHLARSVDGAAYTALNNGRGLLYPTTGLTRLGSPLILRAPDGTFRLIATENGSSTRAYVYASDDLLSFSGEKLVTFAPSAATIVAARYDNGIRAYRITYSVGGSLSEVTTEDFGTFSAPVAKSGTAPVESGTFPTGSRQASSIGVTADELAAITTKYSRVVNTGVSAFEGVTVDQGNEVTLPETATVEYSSGDTTAMSVQWDAADVAALDGAEPGTYTVDGTVSRKAYPNPLVERRADPDVTKGDDGWYYFTGSYPMVNASDPQGYDRVILRRAKTIEGLKTAAESTIWHENTDSVLNRYIWAPELEKIGDDWYILFTASRSGVWDIRPAMLKYVGGDFGGEATLNSANWVSVGQVKAATGDAEAFTHFSLDMTHFESEGRHYLVWAEKPAIGSTLRMAEIDPENPTQLLTKSILLSTPTFAWEKNAGDSIDEGPAVIIKDGKIVIAFSAATVDDKYCVGVLTADVGADLLDVSSWTKNPYPLLTTDDVPGQVGPGHNSFTVDELGNPVIVYHSRTVGDTSNPGEATDAGLYDPRRHARAATVHWSADGLPVFNMTAAEELKPEYSAVSVTVTVRESLLGDTTLSGGTAVDGWYPGPVTVTAALSETRPATSVEIKVDGGEWTAVPLDSPSVQVENDGQHSVLVRAADGGEWQEAAPVSFGVDTTAPVTTAVADGSARTLTLTAEDAGVGVDTIQYQLGDAGDWVDYTEPVAVGDAAVTVSYRSVDALGNEEEARAEQFDAVTIPPAASTTRVTVTPKSGAYGATRKLVVTVTAAGTTPTGTVVVTDRFGVRTTTVASGALKSGKVTLTLPKTLKVGSHGLTIKYSGSGTVNASSATASVKVAKASASVKATLKRAGSKGTAAKRLKATVTVTSSTKVPVTGKVTVTVKKSGKTVTTKSVSVKTSGKKVTLTTKALKKGKYTVTIRYAGSSTVNAATITKSYRVK